MNGEEGVAEVDVSGLRLVSQESLDSLSLYFPLIDWKSLVENEEEEEEEEEL